MKSKILRRIINLALAAVMVFSVGSFVGCSKDKVVRDGKTVNIRTYRAGYGVEWVYELQQKFESVYKEQGYKINVLTPSSDMRNNVALTDMALGNVTTGVDLYLIGGVGADSVGENGDYGVLAEDIEQIVYTQKPIGYDGVEEDKTIKDKLSSTVTADLRDGKGVMYGFNWATSSAGLVVNTKKLARYELSLPRTTNEMFAAFDKIYKTSKQTSIYPVTYVSGTNGYVNCALGSWHAQYDYEGFNKFWSMTDEGLPMIGNGYEVFGGDAIESMLSIGYHAMDWRIAASGSTSQELDQAQSQIMDTNRGAVFMFNGDWMLNEVKANYLEELDDIEFINTPVNSDVGLKLFGPGTAYDLSESEADKLLSGIISKVDENASVEDIVAAFADYNLTAQDATVVAQTRGLTYCRGTEQLAYIAKDSPVKDIAALVLRMMASDDFAETFATTANCATPYAFDANITNKYKFVRQSFAIVQNRYYKAIVNNAKGFRKTLGITSYLTNVSHLPSKMYNSGVTMYDGNGGIAQDNAGHDVTAQVYVDAAKALIKSAHDDAQSRWNNYLTSAGISKD